MFSSGLVLEGGGLRAAYESGVTDAFIENNITFPYVIGVSAGSCNGVSFIAKNLHRMRDIMVNYAHDERYMGIKSIFKNGEYLNSKWIFGELSYEMFPLNYDEFENSKTKFCVVASNAKTGKAEYFYPTDFRKGCEIIHASCALPMATRPVQIGKDMYYDGGICDSIPLKKAYEDGCEKCVVVLTQDRHFIKKPLGKRFINFRLQPKLLSTGKICITNKENLCLSRKSLEMFLCSLPVLRSNSTLLTASL